MFDRLHEKTRQTPQNARGSLTNGPTCYSLMLAENNKANRAECWNTPHGSNPTLIQPVTGLHGIIQDRGTSVLRGFCGPTDSIVGLGRFAVLGMGEV
ncbi:MAG TPA: hypothetical protein PKD55_14010 [Bellilinea sp.]|nr:hypothetical protein [Bellilinea sp.]